MYSLDVLWRYWYVPVDVSSVEEIDILDCSSISFLFDMLLSLQ